jgi:tRNA modification GTPase
LRPAEAGEFTRRAFLNGKLDLVEVEALADVIAAETVGQLRLAQRVAEGELSRRIGSWRGELVWAMAMVEASIDFADEGDVEERSDLRLDERLEAVLASMERVIEDGGRGERLRDGVTVVIAGPPNAGKSTLLNALARREAAIVSPFAGTTRDPIEVHLDLAGVPVTLVDTAGLREAENDVEAIGVERARDRIAGGEVVLWLEAADERQERAPPRGTNVLRVATKIDLAEGVIGDRLGVSALTGAGIAGLVEQLAKRVKVLAGEGEDVLITRARQRAALGDCASELRACLAVHAAGAEAELEGEHLRLALRALGRLTGQVDVEELLGEIFSQFCIGK